VTEEDEWVSISATYDDEEFMVGKVDGEKTNSEEEFHQLWQNKVGDSSSPVSQSEDHNGKGAVQDAQSRVSGEPPKTSEEEIQLSDYLQGLHGHEVIDKIRQEKTIDLSENDEPKTVAVRIKYENSPFGWLYSEDPKYGKLLNAKREELVRLKDVEKLLEEVRAE